VNVKKQYKLTQDGINELKSELDRLIGERATITERIKSARELGDLSENAEYASARSEQEASENRIAQIEHILKNVEKISAPKTNHSVKLGACVKLTGEGGKVKEFQIVGTVEADPLQGKISDESPIGQMLLGKKVGEAVELVTPTESATYTITELC
jgi:transcription elongation factor GreA